MRFRRGFPISINNAFGRSIKPVPEQSQSKRGTGQPANLYRAFKTGPPKIIDTNHTLPKQYFGPFLHHCLSSTTPPSPFINKYTQHTQTQLDSLFLFYILS